MTTAVLYGAAFVVPAVIYFAMEPRKSTREAQIRAAAILFGVAVFWGSAVFSYSQGSTEVVILVCSVFMVLAAGLILVKGRQPPPG
ncbi:hypothetical protein [[Mycobacterium] wendilense]|uniref:Uncharacterized protein n=1 Tax=[Mycobacterium] wendilense TaxID=3064284 RepID=A0ABN9P0P9_9MYCO|nr:hypothetical protein [Mycolicibacterium sp. MU0050]CAJ1584411.1 hypothetical protein MU0050_003165 [Mycolicibacterium sp. MU0050]